MVDFSPDALVCDIESDSFTDSSASTLSDSNCPASFFICLAFPMASNKMWDVHLLATSDMAKTCDSSCFCLGCVFFCLAGPVV